MRLLIIAAAAVAASVSAADLPAKLDCHVGPRYAAPVKAVPKKLVELPPGKLILTVFRKDGKGCPVPLVVREGIGARPPR